MSGGFAAAVAGWFRADRARPPEELSESPRILVIRRNRMGDMICTLPLLRALRDRFPQAHLAVACDAPGEPIARACPVVDQTILLGSDGFWPLTLSRNVRRLQGFDLVIAAKGGFDGRLARLTKLSRGKRRIGFLPGATGASSCYTDPVPAPPRWTEHQIETMLRLLGPLGIADFTPAAEQLRIEVPEAGREFARQRLEKLAPGRSAGIILINLSSTSRLRFGGKDFLELTARVLEETDLAIGFVSAPADAAKTSDLAARAASRRVTALPTPSVMDLAAILERAALLVTPEGGAGHLAATVGAPAVVLWSEGPFVKWRSRGDNHVFVQAARREKTIPVERVWEAVKSLLESLKI